MASIVRGAVVVKLTQEEVDAIFNIYPEFFCTICFRKSFVSI